MSRYCILFVLVSFLCGCEGPEIPKRPDYLVYKYLLEQLVFNEGRVRLSKDVPVFIATKTSGQVQDPSGETLRILSGIWPVRKISDAIPLRSSIQTKVVDRTTGRQGWMIWIIPVQADKVDSITLKAGVFSDGTAFEDYEFHLIRSKEGWIIKDVKLLGVG